MSFYDPNRKSTTSGISSEYVLFCRGLIKQIQVLFLRFCEIFKSMIIFRLTNIFIIFYIHIWLYIYVLNRTWDGWLRWPTRIYTRIKFIPNFCNIFNTGNHSTQIKLRDVDSLPILLGTTLSLYIYIIYNEHTSNLLYVSSKWTYLWPILYRSNEHTSINFKFP
jgi:hypothetical protein